MRNYIIVNYFQKDFLKKEKDEKWCLAPFWEGSVKKVPGTTRLLYTRIFMITFDMPELLSEMAILALAKINLHLAIKDKRPDGFHDIESVFLALDWGDTLFFETGAKSDELFMNWANNDTGAPSIPGNIILRALALFREKTGFLKKFKITVEKRIPLGGGLGGGSSDAAAALLALNKIAGSPLGKDALLEMGAALGSDVPFFLREIPAAWVTGRGEHIEPIEIPQLFLVLVNPGFPSNTAEAYRLLDEYRDSNNLTTNNTNTANLQSDIEVKVREGSRGSWLKNDFFSFNFYNDFLPVFKEREKSIYNKICCNLLELGAVFASLSGAGSTCFGVFSDKEQARKAAQALSGKWSFVHWCTGIK